VVRVELKARSDLSTESKYRSGSSKRLSPVPDEQSEAGGTEAAAGVARRREGDGERRGWDGMGSLVASLFGVLLPLPAWEGLGVGVRCVHPERRRERRALQLATGNCCWFE